MVDRELEKLISECAAEATQRHKDRAIDYYNTLMAIAEHPMTPNAVRLIAERRLAR